MALSNLTSIPTPHLNVLCVEGGKNISIAKSKRYFSVLIFLDSQQYQATVHPSLTLFWPSLTPDCPEANLLLNFSGQPLAVDVLPEPDPGHLLILYSRLNSAVPSAAQHAQKRTLLQSFLTRPPYIPECSVTLPLPSHFSPTQQSEPSTSHKKSRRDLENEFICIYSLISYFHCI